MADVHHTFPAWRSAQMAMMFPEFHSFQDNSWILAPSLQIINTFSGDIPPVKSSEPTSDVNRNLEAQGIKCGSLFHYFMVDTTHTTYIQCYSGLKGLVLFYLLIKDFYIRNHKNKHNLHIMSTPKAPSTPTKGATNGAPSTPSSFKKKVASTPDGATRSVKKSASKPAGDVKENSNPVSSEQKKTPK